MFDLKIQCAIKRALTQLVACKPHHVIDWNFTQSLAVVLSKRKLLHHFALRRVALRCVLWAQSRKNNGKKRKKSSTILVETTKKGQDGGPTLGLGRRGGPTFAAAAAAAATLFRLETMDSPAPSAAPAAAAADATPAAPAPASASAPSQLLPLVYKKTARRATIDVGGVSLPIQATQDQTLVLAALPRARQLTVALPHSRLKYGDVPKIKVWVVDAEIPGFGAHVLAYVPHRVLKDVFTLSGAALTEHGQVAMLRAFQPQGTLHSTVQKWRTVAKRNVMRRHRHKTQSLNLLAHVAEMPF